jgi:predicted MFS family arabinose efflux permease
MQELDAPREERRTTFRDVFAVPEFRALWAGHVVSLIGDQLARVALSYLVYEETGSTLLTALTYAIGFLPWLIGGPLLSGLADRLPRRTVMVVSDLLRAAVVALMAVPGVPLPVLLILLFVAELCAPPFASARAALLPQVLAGELYVLGSAVSTVTWEVVHVVGFVLGGLFVAAIGVGGALVIDALTFVASALILLLWVKWRPVPEREAGSTVGLWADLTAGVRLVFGDPWLRKLTVLAWLCSVYMVPEALAVPIAVTESGGATAVGLLLAANPIGTVIGSVLIGRYVPPERRLRWLVPMAFLCGVPLAACLWHPGLLLVGLLWGLSGLFSAYNLTANAAFVQAVPDHRRGQALGLVQSGMAVGQGLGFLVAGAAAELVPPLTVVAWSGALTCVVVVVLAVTNRIDRSVHAG